MENLFGKVSTALSGVVETAFREAVSMADDMHAIIVADVDDVNKKNVAKNKKKSSVPPSTANSTPQFIRSRTNTTKQSRFSSAKEEVSSCDTLEEEPYTEQPTSADSDFEEKGSPATLAQLMAKVDKKAKQIVQRHPSIFAKLKTRFGRNTQPTSLMMVNTALEEKQARKERSNSEVTGGPVNLAKLMADDMRAIIADKDEDNVTSVRFGSNTAKRTRSCDTLEEEISIIEQPTSADSDKEVKGSPADLAKLMMKFDKQAKQIEMLKQQLSKVKEEELETRKGINALAAKFHDILDESGLDDGNIHTQVKQSNDDQIPDDQTTLCSSFDDLSDDDRSEWEQEHWEDVVTHRRPHRSSRKMVSTSRHLDSTSRQISNAFNQAIFA